MISQAASTGNRKYSNRRLCYGELPKLPKELLQTQHLAGWARCWITTQRGRFVKLHRYVNGTQEFMYEHRWVWAYHFGDIPPGYVVHHIDGDQANNSISNLRCLTQGDHRRQHSTYRHSDVCIVCHDPTRKVRAKKMCDRCYAYLRVGKQGRWWTENARGPYKYKGVLCSCGCGRQAQSGGMYRNCREVLRHRQRKLVVA
jgi:hypothetical protein